MKLKQSVLDKAIQITSSFEGSGYVNVTGNFDGQFLSLGFIQFCLGQGTLQPLLKKFYTTYPVLTTQLELDEFKNALNNGTEKVFARDIINAKGTKVVEPWKTRLTNLCKTKEFQAIQIEGASAYINRGIDLCNKYGITTDRGFCLCFDIAVQNGSLKKSINVTDLSYHDKLKAIAEQAISQSNLRWQTVVKQRKMCIVDGSGIVYGSKITFEFDDKNMYEEEVKPVDDIPQWKTDMEKWLKDNGIITSDHSPVEQIDYGTLGAILKNFVNVYKLSK